jgi:hypothetical protein
MQQDGVTHAPLEQTLPDGQWLSLQHSLQALLQHLCPAEQQVPLQHSWLLVQELTYSPLWQT